MGFFVLLEGETSNEITNIDRNSRSFPMKSINSKLHELTHFINELCEKQHTVGISVSITYENEIIYAEGFGYSQLGSTPKKITPDTIMSIQSISKNFMATSIMQAREQGLIYLETPVVDYLPYFRTKDKKMSDRITVRQLLSHTAGFPPDLGIANLIAPNVREIYSDYPTEYQEALDYYGLTEEVLAGIRSREDITKWCSGVQLCYPPGTSWDYCTDAFVIACDLFEKVSGQSWESHLEKYVLGPLKMSRTTCDHERVESDGNHAQYYLNDEKLLTPYPKNPISAPIGFLYSTSNDLARYAAAHMSQSAILNTESLQTMQTAVKRVTEEWRKGSEVRSYGLAWFVDTYKGFDVIEHGGGQLAVRSLVAMIPSKELGVAVLLNFNSDVHHTISRKVFDIVLEL